MIIKKQILLFIVLFCFSINLFTIEKYIDLDFISKATHPRFTEKGILFTLPPSIGKNVFLRTNLDNWGKNYFFSKSLFDIYFAIIPYNLDKKNIEYKLNVDGLWQDDPTNSSWVKNNYGEQISQLILPKNIKKDLPRPSIESTENKIKNVTFYYENDSAQSVSFVCSFDNWSLYSHQMVKSKNGYWQLTLPFTRGFYSYFFFVDGEKVIDIDNPHQNYDALNGDVSSFSVE